MGLVDVREADFSLRVRLVYATVENFTGKVLYTDLRKAFLLPEMAERLKGAHRRLKQIRPDLRIRADISDQNDFVYHKLLRFRACLDFSAEAVF